MIGVTIGVVVGCGVTLGVPAVPHPERLLSTAVISSLIIPTPSPFWSQAPHWVSAVSPRLMLTQRINSLIATASSLLQSPVQSCAGARLATTPTATVPNTHAR